MKVVIIGGSGHVGTYLVPRLVDRGYVVVNVSRGKANPYKSDPAWGKVENVTIDRKAEEASGEFGHKVAALEGDVVVDMISFELDQVKQLVEALKGHVKQYIFCSSIWVGGYSTVVPAGEDDMVDPLEPYGTQKAQIESYLLTQARAHGFPATSFRPGHIVGEGWPPVNPLGNLSLDVWERIATGKEITLPDHGLATLHHVHADDCASMVLDMIDNPKAANGQCFNNVSPQALTMRGYAETMYRWFGKEPKILYQPFDQWKQALTESDANASWSHISHSPCASIEKSRRLLGHDPKYSSVKAIQQAVDALKEQGKIKGV